MRGLPAALALLLTPALAQAQAYQCSMPSRIDPLPVPRADGPARRTPISGYTLAATWSPEYCKSARETTTMQCSGRQGRFGFVLHGLWPEARRGPPPQWCSLSPRPTPDLVRRHLCMTPAPGLLVHEWAKHGSCMVRNPAAYYQVSAILWRSVRWPDADRLSRRPGLTVGEFRRAFVESNPDWRENQVGLVLSRNGWLREVRLCYGRDFRPAACDRRAHGPRDGASLKIWRGL